MMFCDDITFCPQECEWIGCPRNQRNIRDKTIPHSYSIEIPSDCPRELKKKTGERSDDLVIKGLRCISGECIYCRECGYSNEKGSGRFGCKQDCASDAIKRLQEKDKKIQDLKNQLREIQKKKYKAVKL